MRRHRQQPFRACAGAIDRRAGRAERGLRVAKRLSGRHGDDTRAVALHLLREAAGVPPGREPHHLEPVGLRLDHGQGIAANRSGRAKNGNPPHVPALPDEVENDVIGRCGEQPTVDAVEHAAVARNDA